MSLLRPALSVLRTILDDPSNTGEKSFRLFAAAAWQIYKRSVPFPIVLPLDNGISFIADPASGNSVGAIYTAEQRLALLAGSLDAARQHQRVAEHQDAFLEPEVEMADPQPLVDQRDQRLHFGAAALGHLEVEGTG